MKKPFFKTPWYYVIAVVLILSALYSIGKPDLRGTCVFMILIGVAMFALPVLRNKKASSGNPRKVEENEKRINGISDATSNSNGKEIRSEEDFRAAGVYYYSKNVQSLAKVNPQWNLSAKELVEKGKVMEKVFHYRYINSPVELVHEPNNKEDPNAVAILIAGKKVGHIKREENVHVLDILKNHRVLSISSFIGGGEYKVVSKDESVVELSNEPHVTVTIQYVL